MYVQLNPLVKLWFSMKCEPSQEIVKVSSNLQLGCLLFNCFYCAGIKL